MKTIKFKFLILIPILICLLAGCTSNKLKEADVKKEKDHEESIQLNKDYNEVKVFFTRTKGKEDLNLVTVKRKVSKDGSLLEGALRELFLGPTEKERKQGVRSEVPIGTRLIKIEESETDILLDVSNQYLTGGGAASVQLRYIQLYNTVKNIEPNKKLYLHVEGKAPVTIAGEGLEVSQPLKKIEDYTKKFEKTEDIQP